MRKSLAQAWAQQIAWCDQGGSPFTARVLEAAWADRERGGALASLLPDWPGDPLADAVALRVAGALHGLAISRRDEALAAVYTAFDTESLPAAVAAALDRHRDVVAGYLALAPQTNEIGRSAGLNQLWHRYRYELGSAAWGDAASPVRIHAQWQGAPPALPARIEVASHAACDIAPIDLHADGAALRLMSYVWPDQHERLERLRATCCAPRWKPLRTCHAADAFRVAGFRTPCRRCAHAAQAHALAGRRAARARRRAPAWPLGAVVGMSRRAAREANAAAHGAELA